MRKIISFGSAAVAACALTAFASADVVLDQIGAIDGSDVAGSISASQDFEDAYNAYDIIAVDAFSIGEAMNLSSASAVISGWNGYAGIGGVTGFTVSIFSSVDAAAASIFGDVMALYFDAGDVNDDWGGGGDLVSFDLGGFELAAGDYYLGVTPANAYASNGQTGIVQSNLGDGSGGQGNPAGGFGFNFQFTGANYAYRLDGDAVPAPGALALLGLAGLAGRRRRS